MSIKYISRLYTVSSKGPALVRVACNVEVKFLRKCACSKIRNLSDEIMTLPNGLLRLWLLKLKPRNLNKQNLQEKFNLSLQPIRSLSSSLSEIQTDTQRQRGRQTDRDRHVDSEGGRETKDTEENVQSNAGCQTACTSCSHDKMTIDEANTEGGGSSSILFVNKAWIRCATCAVHSTEHPKVLSISCCCVDRFHPPVERVLAFSSEKVNVVLEL